MLKLVEAEIAVEQEGFAVLAQELFAIGTIQGGLDAGIVSELEQKEIQEGCHMLVLKNTLALARKELEEQGQFLFQKLAPKESETLGKLESQKPAIEEWQKHAQGKNDLQITEMNLFILPAKL